MTNSKSLDDLLRIQGVSDAQRDSFKNFTPKITLKHYKDTNNLEIVEVEQGPPGNTKIIKHTLNWTEAEFSSPLTGQFLSKSRRTKVDDLTVPQLKEGWSVDTVEHGLIEAVARSKEEGKWVVEHVSTRSLGASFVGFLS